MRILHVIQELRTGGAERVVLSLAGGQREAGHEVAVAAAPGELETATEAERFDLPVIGRRPWRVPAAALALRRAVRRWRPTIVHAHNPAMGLITGLSTGGGRSPVALLSLHGSPEEDWAAVSRLSRLSRLDLVACGPGVEAALEERGISVRDTVTNAVGPAPLPADRTGLERDWQLDGRRLVLAVGRLVEQKNHGLAIRALEHVPTAKLVIAGEGPLRPELEELARLCGVDDRVVFAGLRPDARALMAAADAIVLPSRWEGLPLTALEAHASGTPLVATAVRGVQELLEDGEDALLVAADDPVALGEALRRVLDDSELADRLAEGGRRAAADRSEERMVAAYLRVYGELLGR